MKNLKNIRFLTNFFRRKNFNQPLSDIKKFPASKAQPTQDTKPTLNFNNFNYQTEKEFYLPNKLFNSNSINKHHPNYSKIKIATVLTLLLTVGGIVYFADNEREDNIKSKHLDIIQLMQIGDFKSAYKLGWKKAFKTPNDIELLILKGCCLIHLNELDAAITELDTALKINPNSVDAAYFKAGALCRKNQYENAIQIYDKILMVIPNYADAYFNKGYALSQLNKYQEAIAAYENAIKFNPENRLAYEKIALIYRTLGDDNKEKEYIMAILKLTNRQHSIRDFTDDEISIVTENRLKK